eukprot:scaffold9097_cov38-Cyclotella_meneghiniana.AAC.8
MARRNGTATNGHANTHQQQPQSKPSFNRYAIHLSYLFTIVTLSIAFLLAFFIGWSSRVLLLQQQAALLNTNNNAHPPTANELHQLEVSMIPAKTMSGKRLSNQQLPSPKVLEGKDVPYTTYTSKTFHTAATVTANTLHIDRSTAVLWMTGKSDKIGGELDGGPDLRDDNEGNDDNKDDDEDSNIHHIERDDTWTSCSTSPSSTCSRSKPQKLENNINTMGHNTDDDDQHLPAGQHLLIDFKDVSPSFLNSETQLASAMISLIDESRLTLLSYHCHSLVPIGVSCAGVLLESHVAFHTWPAEGVIVLDLFTCGGMPLIPVLPLVEKLFGVGRGSNDGGDDGEEEEVKPSMIWAHKLRGFREGFSEGYDPADNPLDGEMEFAVLGRMGYDLKRPLVSTQTSFQSVDIYQVLVPRRGGSITSYRKSLDVANGSYESSHPELYRPDKILFLGGVMQSSLYGEAAYHESIVHPPLITHVHPKRVAVVGGGEGATLREVLKHRSVETAVMIEIDEEVVELSREYLTEWADCSDIEGSDADWCLEDERVEARYEDAMAYFMTKFATIDEENANDRFDVIIMDALDPNDAPEIAEMLYQSDNFIGSLYRALTEDGILTVQVGETPWYASASDEVGVFANRGIMIGKLQEAGFKSIHIYEESHSEFYFPWSTLVAFKDYKSRANWYRSAAEIDIELQKRILPTKSGARPLKHYDAATQVGYQRPSKAYETNDCRSWNGSNKCGKYGGFDPRYSNVALSDVRVDEKGAIVAQRDIAKHSWLGLDVQVKSLTARPSTWSIINSMREENLGSLKKYFEAFGACNMFLGQTLCCANVGILQFLKNDNESYNIGDLSLDLNQKFARYRPLNDRQIEQILRASRMTLRDISQGEEIV